MATSCVKVGTPVFEVEEAKFRRYLFDVKEIMGIVWRQDVRGPGGAGAARPGGVEVEVLDGGGRSGELRVGRQVGLTVGRGGVGPRLQAGSVRCGRRSRGARTRAFVVGVSAQCLSSSRTRSACSAGLGKDLSDLAVLIDDVGGRSFPQYFRPMKVFSSRRRRLHCGRCRRVGTGVHACPELAGESRGRGSRRAAAPVSGSFQRRGSARLRGAPRRMSRGRSEDDFPPRSSLSVTSDPSSGRVKSGRYPFLEHLDPSFVSRSGWT